MQSIHYLFYQRVFCSLQSPLLMLLMYSYYCSHCWAHSWCQNSPRIDKRYSASSLIYGKLRPLLKYCTHVNILNCFAWFGSRWRVLYSIFTVSRRQSPEADMQCVVQILTKAAASEGKMWPLNKNWLGNYVNTKVLTLK